MPAPVLVTIRPGVQFVAPAAASWLRMEKAVGRPIHTNSTYRDWDTQYKLWTHWTQTGQPPRALNPDDSMHCKGLAADTDEVSLLKSLADYGWRQTAPDEDWHFEYKITLDNHVGDPADSGDVKPFPPQPTPVPPADEEDEDMAKMKGASYVRAQDKATVFLLFNEESGFWVEHTGVSGSYNNGISASWETNAWAPITEAHAKSIKASLDKTRTRT